jgi:hypothetical protein
MFIHLRDANHLTSEYGNTRGIQSVPFRRVAHGLIRFILSRGLLEFCVFEEIFGR